MKLTEFAQKRPVVIFMIAIFIIVMGIIAYVKIPMMLLPEIKVPGAIIKTNMIGGTATQVDRHVSQPIIDKVESLGNIESLLSTAYPGISIVTIEFAIGTNPMQALQSVESRVNEAISSLPKSAGSPEVLPLNLTNLPIMTLALQSNEKSLLELTDYAKNVIIKKLNMLPGVEKVTINGARNRAVRVVLDPDKMASYKVNIQNIGEAFHTENVDLPGYFVHTTDKAFLLNLNEKLTSLNQVRQLIIRTNDGRVVRLNQVGIVNFGAESTRGAILYNNKPALGLVLSKVPNANAVSIVKNIKLYIKTELSATLPEGMHLYVAHDNAGIIEDNVHGLEITVLYAIIFASFIVYLFIRGFRSLFIIVVAIPISILMGVFVLHLFGGSFNIVTLLSLVLLVGLVVDDAIVVTENIHRVRSDQPNLSAIDGTLLGTKQVKFSVLASTITLLVIFSASIVMKSQVAVIFKAFSIAILAGVITSYFVSMTMTPLLAERFMVIDDKGNRFYGFLGRCIDFYVKAYEWLLTYVLKFRYLVILLTVIYFIPVFFILMYMGSGFFPKKNDSSALYIHAVMPTNATTQYSLSILNHIHAQIKSNPNIENTYATVNSVQTNKASVYITLKPYSQTHLASSTVSKQLYNAIKNIPGAQFKMNPVPLSPSFKQPLMFAVASSSYTMLMSRVNLFINDLAKHPEYGLFMSNLEPDQVQYTLDINRELANSRGVTSKMIMEAVSLFGGQVKVGTMTLGRKANNKYNIYLDPKPRSLISTTDINKIYLFSKAGAAIQLSTIASLHRKLLPAVVHRNHMLYSVQFMSTPILAVNHALEGVKRIVHQVFGKEHVSIIPLGQTKASHATIVSISLGLGFAFIILYFVLTVQFNSFLQPLIVLAAEPLALVSAVYVLYFFGYTLNVFSLIGILLLMGLVAKNAILLVSRTNQYRREKMPLEDALKKACPERLVPITMTSLTIILAMFPVLFESGPGAENQIVLSTTIMSGIIASTILSVVFVPAAYYVLEWVKERLLGHFNKRNSADA